MRDLVWVACSDCLDRLPQPPRRGCTVCEGTGQYQALRPPSRAQASAEPDDQERNLAWVRTVKEGHRR